MVFQPFRDIWRQLVALKPGFLSKTPHFNFITAHYFWIIGNVIVGSVLLYPVGNLPYIDALFLSSGASTQSGLNTVDVNSLTTYQQLVLFFIPIWCNPITINSFVVFLRLYWFEKRFQHIAKDAMSRRRTISNSRSQMREERDIGKEEKGVDGRNIVVMHHTTMATGMNGTVTKAGPDGIHRADPLLAKEAPTEHGNSGSSSISKSNVVSTENTKTDQGATGHPTQIKFADQVTRSDQLDDGPMRMPPQRTEQDHIAVLERQRNPADRGVLRIPGPRDAERGIAPEHLEEDESILPSTSRRDSHAEPAPQTVQVQEPTRPSHVKTEESVRAAVKTLGIFRLRKPKIAAAGAKTPQDRHPFSSAASGGRTDSSLGTKSGREKNENPYLSWQPTVGRNSAFVDLTAEQREELGGIEYRSLKALAWVLVIYFWGFTSLGFIGLIPWILKTEPWGGVVDAAGADRTWWGFFTATSAFNDVGYTLTPDSMISFQTAIWPLLLMSFLIVIGNTGFPVMLRWIIWMMSKIVPKDGPYWEELRFLLDHPRRCFTLLFPSQATWWLFWILVILNGLDLLFFIILDLGSTIVTALPVNIRLLDGWFQAVSTRTAGLACVNLADLHPGIQASYMIMMYISVLPIAISVRRTNVYEENSLGLYGHEGEDEENGEPSYVGAHLRRQLSFDLWYIFLGFFIITITEGSRIQSNDPGFTMFTVLFEIVSAYGTVGLSLGYPNVNASFSSQFGIISKLIIIAMEIRGRHRGLPYELDRAILLPSEGMHEKEDLDTASKIRRRSSLVPGPDAAPDTDMNRAGGTDGAGDRPWSRDKRTQPSLLSKIMHPGPVVSHHSHTERKRAVREDMLATKASGNRWKP